MKAVSTKRSQIQAAIEEAEKRREEVGISLGGKKYLSVKDRVDIFRKFFGLDYAIVTDVKCADPMVSKGMPVIACTHIREVSSGNVVATGTAMEYAGSTQYTKTSPFEVAETSSIGRALAALGIHGGEFASANEVTVAKSIPSIGSEFAPAGNVEEMIRDLREKIDTINDKSELAVLHASVMNIVEGIEEPEKQEAVRGQINDLFRMRVSFLREKSHREQQENDNG